MSQRVPDKSMLSINRSNDQRSSAADEVRDLEQQMAALDLSAADKHFLRALHQTEKRLNEAFYAARQVDSAYAGRSSPSPGYRPCRSPTTIVKCRSPPGCW